MLDRIEALEAERDALAEKLKRVILAYRLEAMRHGVDYSHAAFDQHIAAIQETDR
jgi:hypothetical protein